MTDPFMLSVLKLASLKRNEKEKRLKLRIKEEIDHLVPTHIKAYRVGRRRKPR